MRSSWNRFAAALLATAAVGVATPPVMAQAPKTAAPGSKQFRSLGELQAAYAQRDVDTKKTQIADLDALTTRVKGEEAEAAYRTLFGTAMANDLYTAAEPAARRYLRTGAKGNDLHVLAALISLIDKADRGQFEESLRELEAIVKSRQGDQEQKLETSAVLSLGEAYLHRLTKGGRYDIAKKVCELAVNHQNPEVAAHFKSRLARFAMVGKPAPALTGSNIDGNPVSLADLKGKVVLVDFWATWCPPCVQATPYYSALRAKYAGKGFEILGVNLDTEREDISGDAKKATAIVRSFILTHRLAWPNIIGGTEQAKAYGVVDIPATFLVDKTGKIIHVEANGVELEQAIADAVK